MDIPDYPPDDAYAGYITEQLGDVNDAIYMTAYRSGPVTIIVGNTDDGEIVDEETAVAVIINGEIGTSGQEFKGTVVIPIQTAELLASDLARVVRDYKNDQRNN